MPVPSNLHCTFLKVPSDRYPQTTAIQSFSWPLLALIDFKIVGNAGGQQQQRRSLHTFLVSILIVNVCSILVFSICQLVFNVVIFKRLQSRSCNLGTGTGTCKGKSSFFSFIWKMACWTICIIAKLSTPGPSNQARARHDLPGERKKPIVTNLLCTTPSVPSSVARNIRNNAPSDNRRCCATMLCSERYLSSHNKHKSYASHVYVWHMYPCSVFHADVFN